MRILFVAVVSFIIGAHTSEAAAQFPVRPAAVASQGVTTRPLGCKACSGGVARSVTVDAVIQDRLGLGVRTVRWDAQPGVQDISLDLLAVDWFPRGHDHRMTFFVAGGIGRGKAQATIPTGPQAESVDSAANVYALSAGVGVDIRVFGKLAVSPSVMIEHTGSGGTHRDCTQRNYSLGDLTWFCGKASSAPGFNFLSLGLGVGWR